MDDAGLPSWCHGLEIWIVGLELGPGRWAHDLLASRLTLDSVDFDISGCLFIK